MESVARASGLSRRALERRFRTHLQRSVLDEIRRSRTDQIARLLVETTLPVSAIAESLGFADVPNAFNPRTNIRFAVAKEGRARLVVYDLRGRVVRTLVDEVLRPDVYTRVWDGTDDRGQTVSSGIYLYRLESEGFVAARKMTLLR